MIKRPTILSQDNVRNIPFEVIDLMFTGWEECGKCLDESKTTGRAKNTNPTAKRLDTLILLKSFTTSGTIHDYPKQLPELTRICKISTKTFYTRLNWLEENNLVHVKGKNLYLHSYRALEPLYAIDTTERLKKTIKYDPKDNRSLAEMLWPLGLKRRQDRGKYMYNKKLDETPGLRRDLKAHTLAYEHKVNQEKLNSDSEYFRQSHEALQVKSYRFKSYQQSFQVAHNACEANPNVDFTQAGLASVCGFSILKKKNPDAEENKSDEEKDILTSSGMGHHLRKLEKKKLITIEEGNVVSEYLARKDEKIFHHKYGRDTRQTIWYRPNHITINYKSIFMEEKAAS